MARCPKCGNEIPAWANGTCYNCIKYEREHGGQSLPPVYTSEDVPQSPSSVSNTSPSSHGLDPAALTNIRLGINELLHDIYGVEKQISQLLAARGVLADDVQTLRSSIPDYYEILRHDLSEWLSSVFDLPAFNILRKLYSLDGKPRSTIADLDGVYDYSRRQLGVIRQNMLIELRRSSRRTQLEILLFDSANQVLQTGGPEADLRATALRYLRTSLGNPSAGVRDGQWEAIQALVERKERLLVVQATGWGKSMVYFLSTRLLRDQGRGPTLLISPLLALMRNQVMAAERIGIRPISYSMRRRQCSNRPILSAWMLRECWTSSAEEAYLRCK